MIVIKHDLICDFCGYRKEMPNQEFKFSDAQPYFYLPDGWFAFQKSIACPHHKITISDRE